ncbi:hypothetical protein PUN28_001193 [Cardiocondyla obscurior]|uniref:Uncharacterized protein n=1 Tax=Cardiocondyla obscurior TaxID=286306 RepID=A0AAW2H428_9HYME
MCGALIANHTVESRLVCLTQRVHIAYTHDERATADALASRAVSYTRHLEKPGCSFSAPLRSDRTTANCTWKEDSIRHNRHLERKKRPRKATRCKLKEKVKCSRRLFVADVSEVPNK